MALGNRLVDRVGYINMYKECVENMLCSFNEAKQSCNPISVSEAPEGLAHLLLISFLQAYKKLNSPYMVPRLDWLLSANFLLQCPVQEIISDL